MSVLLRKLYLTLMTFFLENQELMEWIVCEHMSNAIKYPFFKYFLCQIKSTVLNRQWQAFPNTITSLSLAGFEWTAASGWINNVSLWLTLFYNDNNFHALKILGAEIYGPCLFSWRGIMVKLTIRTSTSVKLMRHL